MNLLKTRFFRHYKNKPYKYIGVVRQSETLEEMALYETLYENDNGKFWVRPKDMFFEDVTIAGVKQPRFRPIEFTYKKFDSAEAIPLDHLEMIHNTCFTEAFDRQKFFTQFKGKKKVLCLIAYDGADPVAMKLGYELSDSKFYSWLVAVKPAFRELGLASELMRQQYAWCREQGFNSIETRAVNSFAKMIRLNLANGFKITGTLADSEALEELKVIFEKTLS